MRHFAEATHLNVRYNTTVVQISKLSQGRQGFALTHRTTAGSNGTEEKTRCGVLVIATGLPLLRKVHPSADPDNVIECVALRNTLSCDRPCVYCCHVDRR